MNILIIEDDKELLEQWEKSFRIRGHTVRSVTTAEAGIKLALSRKFDLIILDLRFDEPGQIQGYEACQTLKSNRLTEDIPIFVITGSQTASEHEARALECADDYVRKPTNFEVIMLRCRKLLQRNFTDYTKVLFLSANPDDKTQLRLDREIKAIKREVEGAPYGAMLDFRIEWAVTPRQLTRVLLDYEPDIVHFSGHGEESDGILLENVDGTRHSVAPATLTRVFRLFNTKIRLVILNACWTRVQAHTIGNEIDCVIGMEGSFGDEEAIAFSVGFYRALCHRNDVAKAFEFGCTEVQLLNSNEQDKPHIYSKPSINTTSIKFFDP